jgi:MFS family permease
MRETLKKLLLVDMLYAFIAAALAVMVPIYMVEMDIDVAKIGMILSLIPLAFMLMRIVFAAVADQVGTKSVEILESIAATTAIIIYALSRSAQAFAIAQFGEGVRDAGFWATARTDILDINGKKHLADVFALLIGIRQFADGLGRLAVGVMLVFFSFSQSFEFLFVLSLLMLVLVFTINKNPFKGFPSSRLLLKRVFRRRPHLFWHHAWGIALQQAAPSALISFLLPVYLVAGLGMSPLETSVLMAVFALVLAIANILAIKLRMSSTAKVFTVMVMVPAYVLLPLFGSNVLFPLVLLAIGTGCGNVLTEKLVSRDVRRSRNVSTEVGVIYFPFMALQFVLILLGGIAVELFGYTNVFHFFALITLYYVLYAVYAFRLPIKKAIKELPVIGLYEA